MAARRPALALLAPAALLLVLAAPAQAQGQANSFGRPITLGPNGSQLVEDFIGRSVEASIVLASLPGPGDGYYHVGRADLHETKLLVDADLPFGVEEDAPPQAPQGQGPDAEPRLLLLPVLDLRGGVAQLDQHAEDVVPSAPAGVHIKVESASLGAGLGLRWQPLEWLHLDARFTAIYAHTTSYARRGLPADRAAFVLAADEILVGWRCETLTALPIVGLRLHLPLGPVTLHPALTTSVLQTMTLSATSALQEVQRTSWIHRVSVIADVPIPGLEPGGRKVYLLPGIAYSRFGGDLADLPDVGEDMLEVSLGIAPDLRGTLPLVSRLGLSVTYVRAQGLEGVGWDVIWII